MRRNLVLLGFGLFLAVPHLQAQRIHVVDKNGNGSYSEIQDAVDVAVDSDLVLVHATGSYSGFLIDAKAIMIRAAGSPFIVDGDVLAFIESAGHDTTDSDAAGVIGILQRGHAHLQRCLHITLRWLYVRHDRVKHGLEVAWVFMGIVRGPPLLGGGVDDREIQR